MLKPAPLFAAQPVKILEPAPLFAAQPNKVFWLTFFSKKLERSLYKRSARPTIRGTAD